MAAQKVAKNVFSSVSDTVFPGSSRLIDGSKIEYFEKGNELLSDLVLQMALYFNFHFSPLWFISCLAILSLKYDSLGPYYKFVLIVVYVVMGTIELLRLYLGYAGNLQEKVPELAGFWLVSFILQLPLTCFLLFNENAKILPLERAVHIIMLLFLSVEVFQGYRTIKRMTDAQVEKFKLSQFDDQAIEMEEITDRNVLSNVHVKKYN